MNFSVKIGERVFNADKIKLDSSNSINTSKTISFDLFSLDLISLIIESEDTWILNQKGSPFHLIMDSRESGVYFVNSTSRIGARFYKVSAATPAYRLASMPHPGGVYTGQNAQSVILDICGDVPVIVKTVLREIPLYGWLPYCNPPEKSARDNLSQVLFAIGASLGTDLDGVLRVEPLWDGISNIADADHMYQGGEVVYDYPVSSVSVTEHQYIPGGDEETLFEGTAESGHLVTFDAPHSSLTAEGFSVLESGANWARLSAGSGTLTGHAYIHTTRLLTVSVSENAPENVKSVTDCTLVSLVNSRAAADRMAAYYGCAERIRAPILSTTHKAGQRISVFNPYDKVMVDGVISSMDLTLSGVIKAESDVLVGYIPPQPEDVEYFDHREVITQSGEWTAPEGVTEGVAVLIGGAWGGWSGLPGGQTEKVAAVNYTRTTPIGKRTWNYKGFFASQGGVGGMPGAPGSGGRILVANFTVPKSGGIVVQIGVGGAGGVYSPDGSQPGTEGTPTTFGVLSSANGSTNSTGYVDTVTGEIFAQTGNAGIAGGTGSGGPEKAPSTFTEDPSEVYVSGSTVTGPDGRKWTPDRLPVSGTSDWKQSGVQSKDGESEIVAGSCFGLSGGAAVGANGANGAAGSTSATLVNGLPSASCWCGVGGKGADAVAPAKPTGNRGQGGGGGHGGGGAGGSGFAYTMQTGSYDKIFGYGELKSAGPGKGSDGAPGGDGVIILYYRTPKQLGAGQVVTRDLRFMFDRLGRILVV